MALAGAGIAGNLLSGIPNIPLVVGKFRAWMDLTRRGIDASTDSLAGLAQETSKTLRSIGFKKWATYWHIGRQLIPLQHRLLMEQIYSDMGTPWSDLITGFGPLARVGGPTFGEALRATKKSLKGSRYRRTPKTSKRTNSRRRRG